MNYGYVPLPDQNQVINLRAEDANYRYYIQLYDHVAGAVDLRDLKVLEVGSGRGGGADYIKRYLKPEIMVGLDFSENAVRFCNEKYNVEGLSFEGGNAESLPFIDNSFDVVLNVESSHCYSSMNAFLAQVKRVLREGGYFLMADFRRKEALEGLRESLNESGLTLIKETDITQNILEAMELDDERKTALIKKSIHRSLVGFFLQFAGTSGSLIHERFISGETIYLSYVLQKGTA
ncbi:MAG: class I SAM-dependent methyltransferase [Anaerolineales bacterium]|nr:class I SAM-dependent methyltransferase [Anaerolineales bacterium]